MGPTDGPWSWGACVACVGRAAAAALAGAALGSVRPGGARARGRARRAPLLRAGCWPAGSVLVRRPRAGLPPAGGGSSSAGHSAGLWWWQRALATWCCLAAPRRSQHFMLFLEALAYVASSLIRGVQCWQLSESDLWTESSNRWQRLLNLKRHLRDERVLSAFALVTRGGWLLSVASPRCWVVQLRLLPAACCPEWAYSGSHWGTRLLTGCSSGLWSSDRWGSWRDLLLLISHFDWQVRVLILKINYCFSQRGTWLVLHCDPEYALFAQQGSPGCLSGSAVPGL